jgi:hypothetical protein
MSEVMRWKLKGFLPGVEGMSRAVMRPEVVLAEDYDAKCHSAEVYFGSWKRTEEERDAAQSELVTLREELETAKSVMAHDYEQLQQRLTAAEQRNVELVGLLQGWLDLFPYRGTFQDGPLAKMKGHTRAALKPTESGASE